MSCSPLLLVVPLPRGCCSLTSWSCHLHGEAGCPCGLPSHLQPSWGRVGRALVCALPTSGGVGPQICSAGAGRGVGGCDGKQEIKPLTRVEGRMPLLSLHLVATIVV